MGDAGYYLAAFCKLFYSVPWAIAFIVERTLTNNEECQGPAWMWSNLAIIYFIWTSVGCMTYILMKCAHDVINRRVASIALGISFLPLFASAPILVGLTISYGRRDECPPLAGILSTWFVLTMIILAIPFLVMSMAFYCGCTAYLADNFGKKWSEKEGIINEQENKEMVELKINLKAYEKESGLLQDEAPQNSTQLNRY